MKEGVPAWNVLMQRPYVGRNVITETKDAITAYGKGAQFKSDSAETKRMSSIATMATALVGVAAIACAIGIIIAGRFDFHIDWNFFTSILAFPLFFIGLIISMFGLDALTYKYASRYKDPYGATHEKESTDVIDVAEGQILVPLLTKFILYPLLIAAAMYYVLMAVFSLLETILPFVIAILLIGSTYLAYINLNKALNKQYRQLLIPLIALLYFLAYLLIYITWISNAKQATAPDAEGIQTETTIEGQGNSTDETPTESGVINFGMQYTFEGTLSNGKAAVLILEGTGGTDFNLSGTFNYVENGSDNAMDLMGNDNGDDIDTWVMESDFKLKGRYDGRAFKGTITENGQSQSIELKQTKAVSFID